MPPQNTDWLDMLGLVLSFLLFQGPEVVPQLLLHRRLLLVDQVFVLVLPVALVVLAQEHRV